MNFGIMDNSFPAILKTLDNKVLEYGAASVSVLDQSIDFVSDFVPICKMGERLKIVRTKDEVETQSLSGEVYLSSQNMLRLVSLTDEVLPGAASAYIYDVAFKGTASAVITQPEEPHGLFSLKHRAPAQNQRVFPIDVFAISMSHIRFLCNQHLQKEQHLTASISEPLCLDRIMLQVEMSIHFGEDDAKNTGNYRCRITELGGENYIRLDDYLQKLARQQHKLFPPISSDGGNLS